MKYVIQARKNPLDRTEPAKYYLQARMLGVVNTKSLTEEIALATSLTRGDVFNCIKSFLDCIPKYLKMGYSVNLEEFCNLRLSIKSEGSDTPDEVHPSKVKSIKVRFVPSVGLKKAISDTHLEEFPVA